MRKYFINFLLITTILTGFLTIRKSLGSYLLTQELSSDKQVQKIIDQQKLPLNNTNYAYYDNQEIDYLDVKPTLLSQINTIVEFTNILGADSDRWIQVSLGDQKLYACEGSNKVYDFLISSGKWAPTPTGDFKIWTKLQATTMAGGSKALGTYYYLPNVPCTMYFYKGYGLHGTYWHNNFGHPMSHGCVNMKTEEACTLFNWASIGTRVNVRSQITNPCS